MKMDPDLTKLRVSMVAAQSANRVIGNDGTLPWPRNKTDFSHFKELTMGKPIIMGRRTFESLPDGALPERVNIVLSQKEGLTLPGATVVATPYDAFFHVVRAGFTEVVVIGGQTIFESFLPYADTICLTRFQKEVKGDTFFPHLSPSRWRMAAREEFTDTSEWNGWFETYERVVPLETVVIPRNGMRDPDYWADLIAINTLGRCPFCPGGMTLKRQKMVLKKEYWLVTRNAITLPGAECQFVIIPRRHVTRIEELNDAESTSLIGVIAALKKRFRLIGGALVLREGDPLRTGASVCHLHYQYIVPEPDEVVSVVFGKWPLQ